MWASGAKALSAYVRHEVREGIGLLVPKNLNTKTLEIERRAQSKARANSSIPDSY